MGALALGLAATGLVASQAEGAMLPLLAVAMGLGAAFVLLEYGFTAGFRDFLVAGDGRALGAAFVVPAIAALVVVPVGALAEGYGRFVAPIGLPLVGGAAMFGVGMQIANGCGSGTLVAAGQGARRMLLALPFFCLGGVLGSLMLPAALRLPGLGVVDLAERFGPWGGLLATELLLGGAAVLVLRGAWPGRRRLLAGAVVGVLAAALFLVSGEPWGITLGLTLWGAKTLTALGVELGGLLMGVGARLSAGCNVGAFLGGASSGSLHGLVWLLACLPGCWLGIRLRPMFGFGREIGGLTSYSH